MFGPLLRAFALRHGLDVLAVSMNGTPLEGWPEAVPDRGRAARLGLDGTPVPAVVLFDTHTKRALPVGFGVIAEDQLAERIFTLTAREAEISTGALSRRSSNGQTQPETPAVFGGRLRSVRHE